MADLLSIDKNEEARIQRLSLVAEANNKLRKFNENLPDWMKEKKLKFVRSMDEFKEVINACMKAKEYGVDTETTGLDLRPYYDPFSPSKIRSKDKICGICLAPDENTGYYAPIRHVNNPEKNLPIDQVIDLTRELLETGRSVYHNYGFDHQAFVIDGIDIQDPAKYEDVFIAERLADVTKRMSEIGLKALHLEYTKNKMLDFDTVTEVKDGRKKTRIGFHELDPELAFIYAAYDPCANLIVWKNVKNKKYFLMQQPIYLLEKNYTPVLKRVIANKIRVDKEYIMTQAKKMEIEKRRIEQKLSDMAGKAFNPGSPMQMSWFLFDHLGLPTDGVPKNQKGYSTAEPVLQKLKDKHAVISEILKHRSYVKDLGTYANNLIRDMDENGDITVKYWQIGADTGRLSSSAGKVEESGESAVAIMTVPKADEGDLIDFRQCFISRENYYMVKVDYSGEELRVFTNMSKEPVWTEMFLKELDLHLKTASIFYNVPEDQVTKSQRQDGKGTNFKIIYGGSEFTLAEQYKIPQAEAARIVKELFGVLKQGKRWIDGVHEFAKKNGYVQTYFGRIRPLPEAQSKDWREMNAALRQSVNTPIQGTAADIIKIAMCKLHKLFIKNGWYDRFNELVRMLITVHDEIVFEIHKDHIHTILPVILEVMEGVRGKDWQVKLVTEGAVGYTWSEKIGTKIIFQDGAVILEKDLKQKVEELGGDIAAAKQELSEKYKGIKIDWESEVTPRNKISEEDLINLEKDEPELPDMPVLYGPFILEAEDNKMILENSKEELTRIYQEKPLVLKIETKIQKNHFDIFKIRIKESIDRENGIRLILQDAERQLLNDDRLRVDPKMLINGLKAEFGETDVDT